MHNISLKMPFLNRLLLLILTWKLHKSHADMQEEHLRYWGCLRFVEVWLYPFSQAPRSNASDSFAYGRRRPPRFCLDSAFTTLCAQSGYMSYNPICLHSWWRGTCMFKGCFSPLKHWMSQAKFVAHPNHVFHMGLFMHCVWPVTAILHMTSFEQRNSGS